MARNAAATGAIAGPPAPRDKNAQSRMEMSAPPRRGDDKPFMADPALPRHGPPQRPASARPGGVVPPPAGGLRSEEHTSELQSHSFISYPVFCLKKNKTSGLGTHHADHITEKLGGPHSRLH